MILKCRACGNSNIESILSLGFVPLANAFLRADELDKPEEKFPLDLVFCDDCTLVQIVETVAPEKLFSEYYYTSSISKTTLENARELTKHLINRLSLDENSTIVEIGSNDGYLLKNYVEKGIHVIGIEPAANIAAVAREKLEPGNRARIITGFFNAARAEELKRSGVSATVIHANNVLAHVANLNDVVEGIKILLKPDGVAVIETHYVRDLVNKTEFDCIYHEHLCYYSMHSLERLFESHGMGLVDIERIPIHGGSLRAYFQPFGTGGKFSLMKDGMHRCAQLSGEEQTWGITSSDHYRMLGINIISIKRELLELLRNIKAFGQKIAIYGASAKSTTLLNYFGIGKDLIEYVVDDTPGKQGHFTPGTHLPIYAPSKLLETKPNYVLILTWNFADEIMGKNQEYRNKGGKFIIPIPEIKVI